MSKPLSRPNELGRAIGYRVDINLIVEKLERVPAGGWERLRTERAFVEQMEQVARMHSSGAPRQKTRRLWVVMKAERGVPVMMDAYTDKRSASSREQFLRRHMHPDVDEVTLFDVKL